MSVSLLAESALTLLSSLTVVQVAFFFFFFFLLISAGGIWHALVADSVFLLTGKNQLEKYARQSVFSTTVSMIDFLLFICLLLFLFPTTSPNNSFYAPLIGGVVSLPVSLLVGIIIAGLLRVKYPGNFIHTIICLLLSSLFIFLVAWWHIRCLPTYLAVADTETLQQYVTNAYNEGDTIRYLGIPLFAFFISVAMAASALWMSIWLIVRRNADNFGRDYYIFAMHRATKQALIWSILSACLAGVYFYITHGNFVIFAQQTSVLLGLCILLECCICIALLFIIRSQTPMRHKLAILLANLFFFCMVIIILLLVFFKPFLA